MDPNNAELVILHTDDIRFCLLCGLIINWSDQPYDDSKLQGHCELNAKPQQHIHTSLIILYIICTPKRRA